MVTIPLCLHPVCRSVGRQACTRGLCCNCYRTMRRLISDPTNRLTEEQLIKDGRLLPPVSGENYMMGMEYGERLEFFLGGQVDNRTDIDRERELMAQIANLIGRVS